MRADLIACVVLAALCFAVYGQVAQFDYIQYDDGPHVYDNRRIQQGLTLETVRWAVSTGYYATWMPLTWLSYAADWEVHGLAPGGYHLTNLALHVFTVWLVYALARRFPGSPVRCFVLAALFALHPLRVEPVVWISSRKDVLSGSLFLLTLHAYFDYARQGGLLRYTLVTLAFAAGLMAKSMLVTTPVVLLLLDYWPLRRWSTPWFAQARRLVIEKLPLAALSAASISVTFITARSGGALQTLDHAGLWQRVFNPFVHYALYLRYTFWPSPLITPHLMKPEVAPGWTIALSLALLTGLTLGAVVLRRQMPWLITGWMWFLIMLLPVIGFIGVGGQSFADRYVYLPQIGLLFALVWTVAARVPEKPTWKVAQAVLAGSLVAVLGVLSFQQTARWRDTLTFFGYVRQIQPRNVVALNTMGSVLMHMPGRREEAIRLFETAIAEAPNYPGPRVNLAVALVNQGKVLDAARVNRELLGMFPDNLDARNNYANVLLTLGQADLAAEQYRYVLERQPDHPDAWSNLGAALITLGRPEEAESALETAVGQNPDDPVTLTNLAYAKHLLGDADQAMELVQRALELNPGYSRAQNFLEALRSPDAP